MFTKMFNVAIVVLTVFTCMGQYDGALPKATPVTPNVAALFKVTERPAGSFSGTTPIDIPVYNIAAKNVSVPVALNYSNGGIKVEEMAGWVGLGWNCSPGGTITRAMRGIPDDYASPGTGYLHSTLKPSGFPGTPWIVNVDNICRNYLDIEPDIFYYNFNGTSGKFYFNESGQVVQISQTGIKIEPVWVYIFQQGNQIKGWIITDEDGDKYYFGMDKAKTRSYIDYTTSSYSSINSYTNVPVSPGYSSTWHLSEIRDLNDEKLVAFTYDSTSSQFLTRSGAYMRMQTGSTSDCAPEDSYSDEVLITTYTDEKILKRIVGSHDSVVFHSSYNRLDLGGHQLDSIRVYNTNGVLTKKFHFNYDYFISSGASSGYDQYRKRLQLKNVARFGSTGTDSITHEFDYVDDVILPSRLSRGVDHWGYYNGQDFNWTLMPNGVYTYYGITLRMDNLADRRPNPEYSVACTLKKITYPTGGYRQFEYENNIALFDAFNSQVQPDASKYQVEYFDTTVFNTSNPSLPAYQRTFTVNSFEGSTTFNYYLDGYGTGNFSVKIIWIIDQYNEYEVYTFNNEYSGDYTLMNGNYRLEFDFDYLCTFSALSAWWAQLQLSSTTTNYYGGFTANNMNAGGIRVKEIKDYDPVADKFYSTKYKYAQFADTTLTSGLLISPVRVAHVGGCTFGRDCQYIRLSSQSHYPLAMDGGSYVVYPEVRTIEDGNGYTDQGFCFEFDGDTYISVDEFPIKPPEDNSWKRGKLVMEKVFDQNNTLLRKKSVIYPYMSYPYDWEYAATGYDSIQLVTPQYQYGWKVVGYYNMSTCGSGIICSGCWNQYSIQSFFSAPKLKIESVYAAGNRQDIKTEYIYYNSLSRPFLKQEKVYINGNNVKDIKYKYAFNSIGDFQFGLSSAEQAMKDTLLARNYLRPLEKTMHLVDGANTSFVEGTKNTFAYFSGTKIHPASSRKYPTLTDSVVAIFSNYDSKGNMTEQYRSGDIKEIYLWGYNYSYPVAKITGSDYNTIAAMVNNSVLQSPSSDAALRTELNNIRTALAGSNAQVTTYTYLNGVGLSSETDASGRTIYYEYDVHGRLIRVRDQDNRILKKFDYNWPALNN